MNKDIARVLAMLWTVFALLLSIATFRRHRQ